MLVGLRSLTNFYDGLRYSLVLAEKSGSNDHEVKFNISFRSAAQCFIGEPTATPTISNASLFVDYIYLDTDERRQFAQVQHEIYVLQSKHQTCLLVIVF